MRKKCKLTESICLNYSYTSASCNTSMSCGDIHTVLFVPGLKYSEVSVWQLWMLSSLNGRLERSKGNSWRGDNSRVLPGGHAAAVPIPPPLVKSSVLKLQWQPMYINLILFSQNDMQEMRRCVKILDTEHISHFFPHVFCSKVVDMKYVAQQKLEEL